MKSKFHPIVTIVCPSNKPLDDLSKAAYDSMLTQDYNNLEIHICFNGITVNQYREISNYLCENNNNNYPLVLSHFEASMSPGSARRYLLNSINSDYILFLDADDVASKKLVRKKVCYSYEYDLDIVISSARTFNGYQQLIKELFTSYRSYLIPYIFLSLFKFSWLPLSVNLVPNSGTLLRIPKFRHILASYPVVPHEDFIFYNLLLQHQPKVGLLLDPLINYNVSTKTTTGNKFKSKLWHYRALKCIKPRYSPFKRLIITLLGLPLMFIILFLNTLITYPNICFVTSDE